MEKSNSIQNIAKALQLFHLKVGKIKKDAENPFFKSSYASLSNILDSIDDPLQESGLTYAQFPDGEFGLTTILMHPESGEYLQATYIMKPSPEYLKEKDGNGVVLFRAETPHFTPQGVGSCITYQRRYALAAILGLNIEDDDDGNTGTHGTKAPQPSNYKSDNNLPWLNANTKEYTLVVERLRNKTATIEQIKQHYKLSKAMETSLREITQPVHA